MVNRLIHSRETPQKWWRAQTKTRKRTAYILITLVVVALLSSLPAAALTEDWGGLFLNLGTELGGAVVTFVLLERIIGSDEERERRKAELIAQMKSQVKEVAIRAVEEIRQHGWLTDGSLKGANLGEVHLEDTNLDNAFLEGANLAYAHLEGAGLYDAHLKGAGLFVARLEGADLTYVHLEGASLILARLGGANLEHARLEGADLTSAILEYADLVHAHLEGADLTYTHFNEHTILPDGTQWTPKTDMRRFTDPDHPNFWQPTHSEANE